MTIMEALPTERKVTVAVYAQDGTKYMLIYKGSSDKHDEIFDTEYDHVSPGSGCYMFFLDE